MDNYLSSVHIVSHSCFWFLLSFSIVRYSTYILTSVLFLRNWIACGRCGNGAGNKVRIRVCTDGGAGADSMEARRLSGRSHEFTLHKYMLTLAPQSEEPFYKDEGGKSKVSGNA